MKPFTPIVMRLRDAEQQHRPIIVFQKGRTLYHAVAARDTITLITLDSLRECVEMIRADGATYPPKVAASYWLNHSTREITKRAKAVLRGLVSRKPKVATTKSPEPQEEDFSDLC